MKKKKELPQENSIRIEKFKDIPEPKQKKEKKPGFFAKLFSGFKKTRDSVDSQIDTAFKENSSGGKIDDNFYDELETILITSDVGYDATGQIIEDLRKRVRKSNIKTTDGVKQALREIIAKILSGGEMDKSFPLVLMMVGVNGVGKTTAIGKLAHRFASNGRNVIIAAADTFRAAASAQLTEWAERAKVKIVKHAEGADPGAVVYDAIASAKAKGANVLIIDTAGRLHNNVNLMEELKKINRIIKREWPEADSKNLIALDATTGQNAISQVELFNNAVAIDGIVLTKFDGTAKGGVVIQIKSRLGIPVAYIGVGEGIDDLVKFNPKEFADNII